MKKFSGKALYQPSGKAAEYSSWAVNFYTGCSNDCEYCYCKRGVLSHVWNNKPRLKKCFKDEKRAFEVFMDELLKNLEDVRKKGILFSFTTDPMLEETKDLTLSSAEFALHNDVPVKILTKCAYWVNDKCFIEYLSNSILNLKRDKIAFGFTLTGADELEPNASSHSARISAMKELHQIGFRTWASIEPVINPITTLQIIQHTKDFCDEYKVGLRSGVRRDYYDNEEMEYFYQSLIKLSGTRKIYLKDSVLDYLNIQRYELPETFMN